MTKLIRQINFPADLKNKNIVGLVTDGDIRREIKFVSKTKDLTKFMTKKPLMINESMPASKALAIMNEKKITSLLVVSDKDYKKKNKVKLNTNNLIIRDSFVEDFGDIKQLLEKFEIKRDKDYINRNIKSFKDEIEKVFSNSNAFEHVNKLSELVSALSLKEDVPRERICILQKDYEELNYIFDFVSQNIVILRRFKEELSPDDIVEKRQKFLMELLKPQMQAMSNSTNYNEIFMKRYYPHIQFFDSLIECYETLRDGVAQ